VLIVQLAAGGIAAAQAAVHVLVLDTSGAPIRGAAIVLRVPGVPERRYVSAANGEAAIPLPPGTQAEVSITAEGFAESSVRVSADSGPMIRVVLAPAPLATTVEVSPGAGDVRVGIPASTTVVTSGVLLTSAAGALDDVLRSTPGFSLFRRSSSRTANPTTQGVTLRGVSGSGASRTLVLADSVPLNDPFGSWVYWNRVPEVAIEKVEVVRGAAGDVWGADALGGVVRIELIQPTHSRVRAVVEGGSRGTFRGSAYAGVQRKGWTLSAAGEATRTDGAYIVAQEDRGAVDVPAFSDCSTGDLTAGWRDGIWQAEVYGGLYKERRGNGTPLQVNDTSWRQLGGSAAGALFAGFWQVRFSGGRQSYAQAFSAVASNRQSERLTSGQQIPTDFARANGQWVRQVGPHDVALGIDWHRTDGIVNETQYPVAGAPTLQAPVGGVERVAAAFARVQLALGHAWKLGVGARLDGWQTTPGAPALASRSADMFSPRLSLSWSSGAAAAHVALSRAYRPPTLNELYRGFRAGNVVTNPNGQLGPERLTGIEGGLVVRGRSWSARATGFANVLDDAIANLTIRTTPQSIVRQRTNSDRIRAAGAEFEAEWRPVPAVTLNAQVAYTDSRFRESAANPDLAGNVVPQVPAWSAGGGITWNDPRLLTVALQARGTSRAFDDDLNTLPLAGFGVVDLYVDRALPRSIHVFVAAENLFDVQYDVARTPLRSIGWPRSVRAGVRIFVR
jgi:outer membrane receptor protein involved in Fe transport